MTRETILVIDDERDLVELLRYNLERESFNVIGAFEGARGLELAERNHPDVIVLDWMMPELDGLEVCRRLRSHRPTARIPVILLTAKTSESDRVAGLDMGADDYITKPFSPRELVARIKALLRRRAVLQSGDLTIDVDRKEVLFRGAKLDVTAAEFQALQLLAASPARLLYQVSCPQRPRLLGEIALEAKQVNRAQLADALGAQERIPTRRIGQILMDRGLLAQDELDCLLSEQEKEIRPVLLGQVLLQKKLVTEFQLYECLRLQGRLHDVGIQPVPRLGDILVKRNLLSRDALDAAVEIQNLRRVGCPSCGDSFELVDRRCGVCGRDVSSLYANMAQALELETAVHRIDLPAEVLTACLTRENDFGKYVRLREVGRGGSGIVYRAWQKDSNRIVALKVLTHSSLTGSGIATPFGDAEDVRRFHSEARAASELHHPNIVRILDFGCVRHSFYLAMPFIEGASLESAGPRGFDESAALVREIALAVDYAHDQGIYHRDLKPGNILIDRRGNPWIIDFGLARHVGLSDQGPADAVIGTPQYMAPEQASGAMGDVDFLADVYSLGAILYEVLGGKMPYAGLDPHEAAARLIESPPDPLDPAIPLDLRLIVGKAMARDKHQRYPGAFFLAEDLRRYLARVPLQEEPIGARPRPLTQP